MRRRVTAVDAFYDSFSKLDESEETVEAFKQLLLRVSNRPLQGREVRGMTVRVMKTRGYGPFLPLRVFYWMDDRLLYLLDVEFFD